MRLAPTVVLLALGSCGAPAKPAGHVAVAARSAEPSPASPPPAHCAYLAVTELSVRVPSSWGSTRPSVWLTPRRGGAFDVWYPSPDPRPFQTARLEPSGELGAPKAVAPFAGMGEASDPAVAVDGERAAWVETVYRSEKDADVMLALRDRGAWRKPVVVLPSPALDTDPVAAFGPRGLLGVAWKHGAYPSAPGLSFAVVGADGRVLRGGVIEPDAEAEGIALAKVDDGWLVVYTPTDAGPAARRALVSLHLDTAGRVLARHVLAARALWPVAASNGREVGVAYRDRTSDGRGVVSFVRLDADGRATSTPLVVDQSPDPLAGFRPLSLVAGPNGWWLGDVASFSASVLVARPSEARVVELDAEGRPTAHTIVSRAEGASVVRLAPHGSGVRGVYVEDRGAQALRAFDLGCGAAPPAAPVDACAARTESFPRGRFAPLRGFVTSTAELGADLVVAYQPTRSTRETFVSRLARDGEVAWRTSLGDAYGASVAVRADRVVAVLSGYGPETFVALDAASGAIVRRRVLAKDAGVACVAPTTSGWLVAGAGPNDPMGDGAVVRLGQDGAPLGTLGLGERVDACSLLPTAKGFLLAYTHPGLVSETSYLFVRELDARGRPRGPGARVPDGGFATSPSLVRRGAVPLLLFQDALGRDLSAIALDDQGKPRSGRVVVAETFGLHAAALMGDELVWSTEHGLGRRGCLDALLAPR